MVRGRVQIYLAAGEYTEFLAPFAKEVFLFPLDWLLPFVKSRLTVCLGIYFWGLYSVPLSHWSIHTYPYVFFFFKSIFRGEPAVSVMAMSLDSQVVDHGSHPGPGGLKLTPGACGACLRSQEENGGEGIVHGHPPWGMISHFLSLCLSLSFWWACQPYSKDLSKKKKIVGATLNGLTVFGVRHVIAT